MRLFRVATALFFAASTVAGKGSDPSDEISIRNALSLYALSVDSKNFGALSGIFAPNFVGNFSLGGPDLQGVAAAEKALADALKGLVSHHQIGTQVVDITSETQASSTAYFTATFFGQGNLTGQIATAYGKYVDSWTRDKKKDQFLISKRLLLYAVSHLPCQRDTCS